MHIRPFAISFLDHHNIRKPSGVLGLSHKVGYDQLLNFFLRCFFLLLTKLSFLLCHTGRTSLYTDNWCDVILGSTPNMSTTIHANILAFWTRTSRIISASLYSREVPNFVPWFLSWRCIQTTTSLGSTRTSSVLGSRSATFTFCTFSFPLSLLFVARVQLLLVLTLNLLHNTPWLSSGNMNRYNISSCGKKFHGQVWGRHNGTKSS